MEDDMNVEPGIAIASGLFVYVMTAVILGTIDWAFPILSDDVIMILAFVLGIATAIIASLRHK
jgi:hypothetical protein